MVALNLPPAQAARLRDALGELGRPPALTAPRAVLHEAALVAIDELGEQVSALATRLLRERGGSGRELREALDELRGLMDVLDTTATPGGGS